MTDKKIFLISSEDELSNLKIGDGLVIENIRECVLLDDALEEKITEIINDAFQNIYKYGVEDGKITLSNTDKKLTKEGLKSHAIIVTNEVFQKLKEEVVK